MLSRLHKRSGTHLLIGENGAGKSRMLAELSKEIAYSEPHSKIITIANTIHNKFPPLRIRNYFRLPSNKINHTSDVIIEALSTYAEWREGEKTLEFLRRALAYIGFDGKIEVSFKIHIDKDIIKKINSMEYVKSIEVEDILRVKKYILNLPFIEDVNGIQLGDVKSHRLKGEIDLDGYNIDFESEYLFSILRLKFHLNKLKIISDINVSLYKKGFCFNLNDASSGELTLLTTLSWISMHIDRDAYILIDEPENSLHPKWQREYFRHLNDLFYYYRPTFVCATHAPILVSGAYSSERDVYIYRTTNGEMKRIAATGSKNIEEVLTEVFQIITPESRYFSYLINKLINSALNNKLTKSEVNEQLEEFRNLTDDSKHLDIIDKIPELIREIQRNG